jgi:hypothetical protein
MGVARSTHREMRNAYKIVVGNPKEERPLGRPRRRLEDNIKTYLRELHGIVLIGFIWLRIETSGVFL